MGKSSVVMARLIGNGLSQAHSYEMMNTVFIIHLFTHRTKFYDYILHEELPHRFFFLVLLPKLKRKINKSKQIISQV